MKANFIIQMPVTETICCATCDHRDKRFHLEKRSLTERLEMDWKDKTKKVYDADCCELLNVDIANIESEELKDIPCKREQWQTTENYYEIGFTVKFSERVSDMR